MSWILEKVAKTVLTEKNLAQLEINLCDYLKQIPKPAGTTLVLIATEIENNKSTLVASYINKNTELEKVLEDNQVPFIVDSEPKNSINLKNLLVTYLKSIF